MMGTNLDDTLKIEELELFRGFVELLKTDSGIVSPNTDRYLALIQHRKAREAFTLAWRTVQNEEIPPKLLDFLFEALFAVRLYRTEAHEPRT